MAEEDNEVLDWGNEDDVVSLGDEDERYAFGDPALVSQNGSAGASSALNASAAPSRSISVPPGQDEPLTRTPDQRPTALTPEPSKPPSTPAPKLTLPTRLTHALPPKPAAVSVPYLTPSDPTIVEATAMASRSKKADNSSPELKDGCRYDSLGPLPPNWEIRFSRDRPTEFYYFNLRYDEATWERPTLAVSTSTDPPAPLSHDDRHYRPEGRHAPGSGRRFEGPGDAPEARHTRHNSGNAGRSPPRARERSRTPSPQGRDSRARGNQRPARGRGNKATGPQKETSVTEAPKIEDRHWVPSPPSASTHLSRSARRQLNRAQNQSTDIRVVDPPPEETVNAPPQREPSGRSHNRDKERQYTPDYPTSNTISTTRSITPSPQDEHFIIYQTKVEPQREPSPKRQRSPGPVPDPTPNPPPPQGRRERPSRFGPGPPVAAAERANGLPMKPVTVQVESTRATDRQHERCIEPARQFEDTPPRYSPPVNRSPVQPRHPEPSYSSDRERISPIQAEILGSASSRKRQPLPPQYAEFRGSGKTKFGRSDDAPQRPSDLTRSPSFTFQGREQTEKAVDHPPPPQALHRSYSGREVPRGNGYNQPAFEPRDVAPEYDRGHERDRPRARQRINNQNEQGRIYEMAVDPPPVSEGRMGYQERERDPPSKPRAMQQDAMATSPTYVPVGPSNPNTSHANRYRDRPSPPHLSMSDSRRDLETRSGPPPQAPWQERRDNKPYTPPERQPTHEPRGRPALTSSANSIPIGNRRSFAPESPANDYPPSETSDRFERPPYPAHDLPRQARNLDQNYPRSYQQEPVSEARPGYSKVPREESQAVVDTRPRRMDKMEPPPRNPATLPSQPENASRQQRQRRFTGPRNSRFDNEPRNLPPQQKAWQPDYDTSPRGRFSNDSVAAATPPPLSREPSLTSPNWDTSPSSFHEPPPRAVDYHETPGYRDLPAQILKMDVDPTPPRQAPVVSAPYHAPAQPVHDRYRRKGAELAGLPPPPQAPPPRANYRRGPSYSPEAQRAPAPNPPLDDMERGGGGRPKWEQTGLPVEDNKQNERPRLLNERISGLPLPPPPEMRGGRKKTQGIRRQDNGYNGEPDTFEVRAPARVDMRQGGHPPLPAKTFEQRLDPIDRQQTPRGVSLLSRISHGGNDVPPPPPSLRDRVQVGNKRDRDEMVRGHFPDVEADDGDFDSGNKRRNKRRRARRGGGPA